MTFVKNHRFKLTDANVAKECRLTVPGEPAQREYFDSALPAFGIRCGRRARTWIVRHDVKGRGEDGRRRRRDVSLGLREIQKYGGEFSKGRSQQPTNDTSVLVPTFPPRQRRQP